MSCSEWVLSQCSPNEQWTRSLIPVFQQIRRFFIGYWLYPFWQDWGYNLKMQLRKSRSRYRAESALLSPVTPESTGCSFTRDSHMRTLGGYDIWGQIWMKYGGDDDVSTVSKVPFEKFLLEFSTRKRTVSLKRNEDQRSLCCPLFA